jgi:Flp pilus assembly protein TadG
MRSTCGAAAAELALVAPLLLIIMMGSFEVGNYFRDEHTLTKAVRDGARFAARQEFSNFDCAAGTANATNVVTPTRNVVQTGLVANGNDLMPKWSAATFSVTVQCFTTVTPTGGAATNLTGIYAGSAGAPVVTVMAELPYQPVLGSLGFKGWGLNLRAEQQAAVMGI